MAKEISKAQREAVARYEAKAYDKTLIRLPKGKLEEIREAAAKNDVSLNGYISLAIDSALYGVPAVNDSMNSDLLTPAARDIAVKAAAEVGRPVQDWITNAIQKQHETEAGTKDLNALAAYYRAKQEAAEKEEVPSPAAGYDFHARRQEFLNREKEKSK